MKVHEKIRFLRREKNLTQEEMAEKLGMSPVSYGKIERGEVDYIAKLEKVANALEVNLVELIANGDKPIYLIGGNDNSHGNNVVIGSPVELAHEIQKLQLQLELKDKELALQQREIENLREQILQLKEINTLLKKD